jgi:outer membrane protein assembly factor BamB
VRAFDRKTGVLVWTAKLPYTTSSAPVIAGNRIYFGMRGDEFEEKKLKGNPPQLIALSAIDGRQVWSMDIEGNVLSAPVVAGGRMLFGTDAHKFYVLEEIFRFGM